jgi:hypothetical protein
MPGGEGVRRALALIATGLLFGASAQPALAAWTSSASGSATGKAQQLTSVAQPTLSVGGQQVTVTWDQVSVQGSQVGALAGGGYTVTRYATGSSTPITPAAGCAGTRSGSAAQLSCTESSVPEGSWRYTVTPLLRNWRGSESALSASAVVDVTAPAVTLTAPANNGWTNNQKPTFSGAAGTDSGDLTTVTVKIYAGATATGTPVQTLTTTAGAGAYSVAPPSNLGQGTYTAQASQSDSAGNTASSSANTFAVDIIAPIVTLTAPAAWTNSQRPTISGAAGTATGDLTTITVKIYAGATATGTPVQTLTTTAGAGAYSVAPSSNLAQGTYTAQASQSDSAGNTGTSSARTFIVDTTAPAVTVNSTCTTNGHGVNQTAGVSGVAGIASGDSTTITVVIYNGTGTGGTVFQTQTITASGATWSAGSNTLTNHATYTVQATQTDAAGNTAISSTCTFSS